MKKSIRITSIIMSLAVVAIGAVSLSTSNKEYKQTSASYNSHINGMYERVNDISYIEDGDKVLICVYNSQALSCFSGNPASAQFYSDGLYFSSDKSLLGVEDSPATEFTVGYDDQSGEYTFRGTMEMTSSTRYDVLLAYVPYDTSTGFDTIGYYTGDRFGAYKYSQDKLNDSKTHFTLSYSGNDSENIQLTNCNTNSCSRAYSIYRKADSKSFYAYNDTISFNVYYPNENLKLNGFYLYVADSLHDSDSKNLYYDENPHMFYFVGDGKAKSDQTVYKVKLRGLVSEQFDYEIYSVVANPGYQFEYVTPGMLKDYRGTYLAVEQEEGTRYFNGRNPSYDYDVSNSTQVSINAGIISVSAHSMIDDGIIIDKVSINGHMEYVATTKDFFPKYYHNPYYDEDPYNNQRFMTLTDDYSEENIITIKENTNGGITIGFTSPDYGNPFYGLSYDDGEKAFFFETKDYYQNARLYKIDKTDSFDSDISGFITTFEKETENCDASGNARTIFETGWNKIKSDFNTMCPDAKGYLANLTYTHNAEAAHTIQDIINRYDFILSKYDDLEDFIGRKDALTFVNITGQSNTPSTVFNSSDTVSIIVIASAITMTLTGMFLLIRRKKQQ